MTDLLYSARFGEGTGYIYILTEHQSKPEKLMPFRMLKYMVSIMDRHLTVNNTNILPVIIRMVIYTGVRPYNYSTDIFDLFGDDKKFAQETLLKPFQLIDFNKLDEKKLEPFLYNLLLVKTMRSVRNCGLLLLLTNMLPYIQELAQRNKNEYIHTIMNYVFEVCGVSSKQELKDIEKLFSDVSIKKCEVEMKTYADILRQQGREKGLEEGKKEAMKQVAMILLKKHRPIGEIAEVTGLRKTEIEGFTEDEQ